jgi:hypothetical protein
LRLAGAVDAFQIELACCSSWARGGLCELGIAALWEKKNALTFSSESIFWNERKKKYER